MAILRHLRRGARLADQVRAWRGHLPHEEYLATLRRQHGSNPASGAGSTAITGHITAEVPL